MFDFIIGTWVSLHIKQCGPYYTPHKRILWVYINQSDCLSKTSWLVHCLIFRKLSTVTDYNMWTSKSDSLSFPKVIVIWSWKFLSFLLCTLSSQFLQNGSLDKHERWYICHIIICMCLMYQCTKFFKDCGQLTIEFFYANYVPCHCSSSDTVYRIHIVRHYVHMFSEAVLWVL